MVLTPVALVIVNVAVPDFLVKSLWLNERVLGLIVETHCGIGVEFGVGVGVAVGVGVGVEFPFPLLDPPLFPLSDPFPFPCGVAVGLGVGVGVGSTSSPVGVSSIGGVGSSTGGTVADGDGSASTSPVTWATSTGGIN